MGVVIENPFREGPIAMVDRAFLGPQVREAERDWIVSTSFRYTDSEREQACKNLRLLRDKVYLRHLVLLVPVWAPVFVKMAEILGIIPAGK